MKKLVSIIITIIIIIIGIILFAVSKGNKNNLTKVTVADTTLTSRTYMN